MSHFTTLVMGEDPETQFEPFCEQTEDAQYLEFFDAEKEYRSEYDSGKETTKEWYPSDNMWLSKKEYKQLLNFGELNLTKHAPDRYFCSGRLDKNPDDEDFKKNVVRIEEWNEVTGAQRTKTYAEVTHYKSEYTADFKDKLLKDLKETPPKEMEEAYEILAKRLSKEKEGFYVYEASIKLIDSPKDIPVNETYPIFSRYLEEYHGLEKDEAKDKYGYWRNPNAKWDWYVLGGRWGGFFTLKDGGTADQALKSEIDFQGMLVKQREKAEDLWEETEEMISEYEKTGKNIDWELSFQYGRDSKDTRDSYIEAALGFNVFSVLQNGSWYEKGDMGWFGCVSDPKDESAWETELNKLLNDIPEDTLLSLYDCHI